MNLQLFAQERREPATPRRRQEARRRGQVSRSVELNTALLLLGSFILLRFSGPYLYWQLAGFMRRFLEDFPWVEISPVNLPGLALVVIVFILKVSLPLMGVAVAVGLAVNLVQVGFIFTLEPLSLSLARLNPAEGFRRLFSKRALVELVKAVIKITAVGILVYLTLVGEKEQLPRMMDMEVRESISLVGNLSLRVGLRISLLLLVLAILDYYYQRWEYEVGLRMTRQEVKEEQKETEGQPQVRARIRERQRQLASMRMMSEIPRADVVITNPTHYAVALRYEPEEMEAPRVVAKGKGYLALRIIEVAKQYRVTLVEDRPLARALYEVVEVGQAIPEQFYPAVAEVLAFVYRLKAG